jgi:TetR/AcrR family transcriptional regulator, transcriptional repressor of bet genes
MVKARARVGRPRGECVENTERRRKQVIDAAVKSIADHGLSDTTLSTIANAAGLSQGTIVFYFKSKEALLTEAFRSRMEQYQDFWTKAVSSAGPDTIDKIIALTFAAIDPKIMTPQNLILWNSFWNKTSSSPNLVELSKQYDAKRLGVQLSLFEDALQAASDTSWTPRIAAHALETMTEGIWVRAHYSPDYMSIKDAIKALGTVLSLIFPARSAEIMRRAADCPDT